MAALRLSSLIRLTMIVMVPALAWAVKIACATQPAPQNLLSATSPEELSRLSHCVAQTLAQAPHSHYEFEDPAKNLKHGEIELGGGIGGDSWAVPDPENPNQVVVKKIANSGALGQQYFDSEIKLFDSLNKLAEGHPEGIGFRLPTLRPFKEYDGAVGYYRQYYPGKTVESLLNSRKISPETRALIRSRYAHALDKLAATMHMSVRPSRSFPLGGERGDNLPTFTVVLNGRALIIKSDNVIVDPMNLTLSLIDPF